MLNIATKELNLHKCKPNCFEKTAVRWDFFYFIAPNALWLCAGGASKHVSINPPLNLIKKKRKYEYSR